MLYFTIIDILYKHHCILQFLYSSSSNSKYNELLVLHSYFILYRLHLLLVLHFIHLFFPLHSVMCWSLTVIESH